MKLNNVHAWSFDSISIFKNKAKLFVIYIFALNFSVLLFVKVGFVSLFKSFSSYQLHINSDNY